MKRLRLSCCKKMTNTGLESIINHSGYRLSKLDLSNTFITQFPAATHRSSIAHLNLSSCIKLDQTSFDDLARMHGKSLRTLDLSSTYVTGEQIENDFLVLQHLNLSHCLKLTDLGLMRLLKNVSGEFLKTLNLSLTKITGESMATSHRQFPNLRVLDLSACRNVSDRGLSHFLQMFGLRLQMLNLSRTSISGEHMETISDQKEVENLVLSACLNLTDLGLRMILDKFGKGPKVIDLSGTQITGESFSGLQQPLMHLEQMSLSECKRLTDTGLAEILNKIEKPELTLKLSYTNISGESFAKLDKANIKSLSLYKCYSLSETGFYEIIRSCGKCLKYLNLSKAKLTGSKVNQLSTKLSTEALNLFECNEFTDDALQTLLSNSCLELKNLNLGRTSISDKSFSGLTNKLANVERVSFFECQGLGDKGLSEFLKVCSNKIQILDLTGSNITGEGLTELRAEASELAVDTTITNANDSELPENDSKIETGFHATIPNQTEVTLTDTAVGKLYHLETLFLTQCMRLTDKEGVRGHLFMINY